MREIYKEKLMFISDWTHGVMGERIHNCSSPTVREGLYKSNTPILYSWIHS